MPLRLFIVLLAWGSCGGATWRTGFALTTPHVLRRGKDGEIRHYESSVFNQPSRMVRDYRAFLTSGPITPRIPSRFLLQSNFDPLSSSASKPPRTGGRIIHDKGIGPPAVLHTETTGIDPQLLLYTAGAIIAAIGTWLASSSDQLTTSDMAESFHGLLIHPQETLQLCIQNVKAMGPEGLIYFAMIYFVAEILAVPATPLTLSAGYLFGLTQGVAVVLVTATVASSVGFFIGKTFLRSWVEGILEENAELRKLDRAIGKEGFKLLLLVRLTPIFPFALSNYVYGASSIDFVAYFWGTLLGFTPGTVAYVYAGMVGQALTLGEDAQPWYVYAVGFAVLIALLKLVTDVATQLIETIQDREDAA